MSVDDCWLVTDPCTFRLNGAEAEGDDGSYFSLSLMTVGWSLMTVGWSLISALSG